MVLKNHRKEVMLHAWFFEVYSGQFLMTSSGDFLMVQYGKIQLMGRFEMMVD